MDVCEAAEIEAVMSQIDTSCHSTLQNALTKGTTLDNSTRCECFMKFNPIVAKTVKCKINVLAQSTLAEEHAQCVAAVPTAVAVPQICREAERLAPFAQMCDTCSSVLAAAIAHEKPLTQVDQCACCEQVGDEAV